MPSWTDLNTFAGGEAAILGIGMVGLYSVALGIILMTKRWSGMPGHVENGGAHVVVGVLIALIFGGGAFWGNSSRWHNNNLEAKLTERYDITHVAVNRSDHRVAWIPKNTDMPTVCEGVLDQTNEFILTEGISCIKYGVAAQSSEQFRSAQDNAVSRAEVRKANDDD